MAKVVLEHGLDQAANMYRMVVGDQESRNVEEEVGTDPDTNAPIMEQRTINEITNTEEFIWDAEDPRWQGMEPSKIADEQRKDVKRAYRDREAAQPPPTQIQSLPGAGETL